MLKKIKKKKVRSEQKKEKHTIEQSSHDENLYRCILNFYIVISFVFLSTCLTLLASSPIRSSYSGWIYLLDLFVSKLLTINLHAIIVVHFIDWPMNTHIVQYQFLLLMLLLFFLAYRKWKIYLFGVRFECEFLFNPFYWKWSDFLQRYGQQNIYKLLINKN